MLSDKKNSQWEEFNRVPAGIPAPVPAKFGLIWGGHSPVKMPRHNMYLWTGNDGELFFTDYSPKRSSVCFEYHQEGDEEYFTVSGHKLCHNCIITAFNHKIRFVETRLEEEDDYGKQVCKAFKRMRKQLADANQIPYKVRECRHKGYCQGTCPACEEESRYLTEQLKQKAIRGEKVIWQPGSHDLDNMTYGGFQTPLHQDNQP